MSNLIVMESKSLRVRYKMPPEAFRSIRLISRSPNIVGNLRYLRTIYDGYEYEKGDALDEKLLNSIRNFLPDSRWYYVQRLVFENQLEDLVKMTNEKEVHRFLLTIAPILPWNLMSAQKEYKGYYNSFTFRYIVLDEAERQRIKDYLPNELLVYLGAEETEVMSRTIIPLQ